MFETVNKALRTRSGALLLNGLVDLLQEGETEWRKDSRDLMMAIAPFHDCAQRIGLDPATVFEEAAARGPASFADVVRQFGARTDITPAGFAFVLRTTPDGPVYTIDRSI
ncbi:hypothetical protein DSM112329_02818 [Paraconexibacter sp. AEG42_29]|uniref:Uncharacterized protein n=1 Tax=Paraconexibacter sp. AEG42_29 TaxID=2997339 RepID=A0AAU7AWB9_9ACTN